jgi:RNA polymerase sigma-70 factor, ECF subfamily
VISDLVGTNAELEFEQAGADRIYALAYAELRRVAHRLLRGERTGHTLNTTALVHEAYLRLAENTAGWVNRGRFFALAAQAMRRILIDYARRHRSSKRDGKLRPVPLDAVNVPVEERAEMLVVLDEALTRLALHDERRSRVVECRFFGGLTEEETAEALGVAVRTVKRDWAKAKAWLYQEMFLDDVDATCLGNAR